jgi:hypothetical protein
LVQLINEIEKTIKETNILSRELKALDDIRNKTADNCCCCEHTLCEVVFEIRKEDFVGKGR